MVVLAASDASQSVSVGVTASSAAPASASSEPVPSSERGLVPSEAAGGGGTHDGHNAIDVDSDGEDEPCSKRAKKSTSEVWQYFTKYWVTVEVDGKVEQQHWAKCNFRGCKNKTSKHRAESRFGTIGFWTHLNNYHQIKKGQQQLTIKKDNETGVAIVQPFKYDQEASVRTPTPSVVDQFMDTSIDDEFDSFLFESDTHGGDEESSDLERYLAEPQLKVTKANHNSFDILSWWKNQKDEYPVLSLLAQDVLAMQVSTVASESAFSAGGRVVDPYRSSLDPEIVQALVCTKDWITAARRGSKNISSLPGDLEVLEAIKNNLILEDEFSQVGGDYVAGDDDDMPEVQL